MPTAQEYLNEAESVLADIESDTGDLDESDIDSLHLSAIAQAVTGLLKLHVTNSSFNVKANGVPNVTDLDVYRKITGKDNG